MSRNSKDFQDKSFEVIELFRAYPVLAAQELLFLDLPAPQRILLEDMWLKPFVLVTAGRGSGKCISGGSYVFTKNGMETISSMGSDILILEEKEVGVKSHLGITDTSKWYYDGIKEVNVITTEYGYSISGTNEHRILVLSPDNKIVWKYSDEISVGDKVAIDTNIGIWPDVDDLDTKEAEVLVGSIDSVCEDAEVPIKILRATKANKALFLKSLFHGIEQDKEDAITYSTNSKKLAKQVHLLLLNFGIVSHLSESGTISIGSDYITTFNDEVTFFSAAEKKSPECSYFYDKVVSVSKSVDKVYDLVVPEGNSFVANGFINHNTFMLSVFSTLYALLYPGKRVLLMSPSFRQCVVGSTLVITERGLMRVNDLKEAPKFLLSSMGMKPCTAWYKNLPEPTKKVTLDSGFSIEGALDHRILVCSKSGDGEYKELKNLCLGDRVYLKKGAGEFQEELNLFVENTVSYGNATIFLDSPQTLILEFNLKEVLDKVQVALLGLGVFSKQDININEETGKSQYFLCVEKESELGNIGDSFIFDRISNIEDGFDYTYDFTVEYKHDYFSNGLISHNSKLIFEEVNKRYIGSPILREACAKKPVIGSDKCYLHFRGVGDRPGSAVEAYPLGTGEKVRGLRGHAILADEFAQIPTEIFDMVIRPMGATTTSPMEKVRQIEELKDKLNKGLITQENYDQEIGGGDVNKIVGVSSAYYQFNHMYRRIQAYEEELSKGSDKYAVHYVSYTDMPEGFLDKDNIEEAKISMSKHEFSMEYDAIWQSDSDGAFKASLIEECKDPGTNVKSEADVGKEYVIGVDPARSSDAFAMVVIEKGNPSYVVNAYQTVGKKFPQMAQKIFDYCENFNVSLMMMDAGAGGGGVALKDLLANDQFFKGRLILDMEDEEYKDTPGRRILKMHEPRPRDIAEANFAAANLLERGMLKFAKGSSNYSKTNEEIIFNIDEMLRQMISVTIEETKSGIAHFDIPATGKGKRKKDLYSAFVLAAKGLYDTLHAREEYNYNVLGIVKPRQHSIGPPTISRISQIKGR